MPAFGLRNKVTKSLSDFQIPPHLQKSQSISLPLICKIPAFKRKNNLNWFDSKYFSIVFLLFAWIFSRFIVSHLIFWEILVRGKKKKSSSLVWNCFPFVSIRVFQLNLSARTILSVSPFIVDGKLLRSPAWFIILFCCIRNLDFLLLRVFVKTAI